MTAAAEVSTQYAGDASPRGGGLRVACIMDEFTYSSYAPEAHLHQLTPHGWLSELTSFEPDVLFVESAWRGVDNLWERRIGHGDKELTAIVDWCRQRGIPTAFWNKEDPIHFGSFLNTASLFDHVFTTDIDCVHRYKAALDHDRISLLPFATQPAMFDPFELGARIDAFCFAGAYYVRYPERARDLRAMVTELTRLRPFLIYDRNHGVPEPDYAFPDEFRPLILGHLPFAQVSKAYKGYRYAINLNSVKQSQSMSARRVFELLSSNTVAVSNYSRAIRLLFGDLVISSDDPNEIVRRLSHLVNDDHARRRFTLAGMRKALLEHTYGERLAYLWSRVSGEPRRSETPAVAVVSSVADATEAERVQHAFERQSYANRELILVTGGEMVDVIRQAAPSADIHIRGSRGAEASFETADLVAGFHPSDHYGDNYLLDLTLATRYTDADVIGKAAYHHRRNGRIELMDEGRQYATNHRVAPRRAVVRAEAAAESIGQFADAVLDPASMLDGASSIDAFNYAADAAGDDLLIEHVADADGLDTGLDMVEFLEHAERMPPQSAPDSASRSLSGAGLASWFASGNRNIEFTVAGDESLIVDSRLHEGEHAYVYASEDLAPADLELDERASFYVDRSPGLDVRLAMRFFDEHGKQVGSSVIPANENAAVRIPADTTSVRPGLRVLGPGRGRINELVLGHRDVEPPTVIGRSDHLVITNQYPTYDNLYRNAFVHRRVLAYKRHGLHPDVFRFRANAPLSFHEFEGVDCITGTQATLHRMLSSGRYRTVMVHFLSAELWEVLRLHVDRVRVIVWVHGSEVQPWHRRAFNFDDEAELQRAQEASDKRLAFWRGLFDDFPPQVTLVFVSRYFAEEVMTDVGVELPDRSLEIIHNPIDTGLFDYVPKPPDQRLRVLSIRPFASRKYANDLSVAAILEAANRPWFPDAEFRIIGDGVLFDETVEPLRSLPNVVLEKRFLQQDEIARLHKAYGVFLNPTRMDAQGVSRDEAMSSGLVPVTTDVAAIPEFVDADCGIVVPPEDPVALADAMERLATDGALFQQLSAAAAERVRRQSAIDTVIGAELELLAFRPLPPSREDHVEDG